MSSHHELQEKNGIKPPTKPVMKVSWEEMNDNRVPMHFRDYCAHLLIPLNQCRRHNSFNPAACGHEKHAYEICLYEQYEYKRALKNYLVQTEQFEEAMEKMNERLQK